jgi:RNA polymerase sigma factor for flagellar operon FliA
MIAALASNRSSYELTDKVAPTENFQVVPTPLFKMDGRHRKVAHFKYVSRELVDFYRPLVRQIVNRLMVHLPAHVDSEDLHSVGLMGLIAATKRYNKQSRETFRAYVKTRVRGAIYDELRRLDCLPRSARAKVRRVQEVTSVLEQKLGRAPNEEEVRKALRMNEKQYQRMVTHVKPLSLVSLDGAFQNADHETKSLHEVIADESRAPMAEECSKREMIEILSARIEGMPKRHRQILGMYYFEGMRISEIAKVFKITEARVCQIQSYALSRLKKYATAILQNN